MVTAYSRFSLQTNHPDGAIGVSISVTSNSATLPTVRTDLQTATCINRFPYGNIQEQADWSRLTIGAHNTVSCF